MAFTKDFHERYFKATFSVMVQFLTTKPAYHIHLCYEMPFLVLQNPGYFFQFSGVNLLKPTSLFACNGFNQYYRDMRFLLYNIRYGTGHKNGYHLPLPFAGFFKKTEVNLQRIINFIGSINPDIVALVEVDSGSYRTGKFCQAKRIAEKLGYNYVVESKYPGDSLAQIVPVLNRQSNALLTRQGIENHQFHYFDQGVKRLIIQTDLQKIAIYIVHLSLKYRHRQNQLEYLHNLTLETKKEIIIAGDFNTFWGSRELNLFLAASGLKSANAGDAPSHPSHAPLRQIDFILHSSGIRIDNFYIPDVRLSDHSPLICDFSCVVS